MWSAGRRAAGVGWAPAAGGGVAPWAFPGGSGSAIGSHTWVGTDWPAQWYPQSSTHWRRLATDVRPASYVTVAVCATGFASTWRTPGRRPRAASTTAFSLPRYRPPTCRTIVARLPWPVCDSWLRCQRCPGSIWCWPWPSIASLLLLVELLGCHTVGRNRRRRDEFTTTDTGENAIAAPAMMGFGSPSGRSGCQSDNR